MGSATTKRPALAITSVRIEKDKMQRFKLRAADNRRSVSQEIRWLIDRAIEEHERVEKVA